MNYNFTISYLNCQSCTAKIHCEKCADELCQRFLQESGVRAVEIDIPNRRLCADAPDWDELDFLDLLEEAGIFAD